MKWINEKTVQGDPKDIKKYCIPKEEYNIPTVNEGIQEGRKLVFCKDCKYWEEESSGRTYCERTMFWIGMDADDFCSRGERREEMTFEDDLIQRLKDDEFAREYIRVHKPFTRCKDCKHWDDDLECCTSYMIIKCSDGREGVSSDADDFCSRGERK